MRQKLNLVVIGTGVAAFVLLGKSAIIHPRVEERAPIRAQSAVPDDLRQFAWQQFELFTAGGVDNDGWTGWSDWTTLTDLQRKAANPTNSALATLPNRNAAFRSLILRGLQNAGRATHGPSGNTSVQGCTLRAPSPCGSVLYNKVVLNYLITHQILTPRTPLPVSVGQPSTMTPLDEGSIIVKGHWRTIQKRVAKLQYEDPVTHHLENIPVDLTSEDPKSCDLNTKATSVNSSPVAGYKGVPISCFIFIHLTNSDAPPVGAEAGTSAREGDYIVLLGMNIARKREDGWIWSAFWWIGDPTAQQDSNSMPSSLVSAGWSHYRADATNSIDEPANPKQRKYCFNPYIETESNSQYSNCVVCHRLAETPQTKENISVIGMPGKDDPITIPPGYYDNAIQTDNLWTISNILRDIPGKIPTTAALKPKTGR